MKNISFKKILLSFGLLFSLVAFNSCIDPNSAITEDSILSSLHFNKKDKNIDKDKGIISNIKNSSNILLKNTNNKTNGNRPKSKNNRKPLSHSNSTQEIISAKNIINMRKYQKNKISNPNSNMQSQIKQPVKNQKITPKYNSNIPSNSGISQKGSGGTGTSININNYYTNDIFNAIFNNFIPHQIYSKFNGNNIGKKKVSRQRASSVIATKNKNNKNYMNKIKKNGGNKNNINKTTNNNTLKKYRTNSTNQLNFKSSEYEYITKIQKWK